MERLEEVIPGESTLALFDLEHSPVFTEPIKRKIHDYKTRKRKFFWLGVDGKTIGELILKYENHTIIIVRVTILKEYQGKGYGKYLLNSIDTTGIKTIEATAKFPNSYHCFLKCGFKKTGEEENWGGSGELFIKMIKRL